MRYSLTVKRFLAIMKRTHVLPGVVCALLMMIPAKGLDCDFPFEMIGTQCLFVDSMEKGSFYDMRFYCTNVLGQDARLVRIENATQLAVLSDYIYFSASVFSLAAFIEECTLPFEQIGNQCLFVDPLECGNFYDMRLHCAVRGMDASLVKIRDASQLEAVVRYIKEKGLNHANYWIAATDEDEEGHWVWSPKGTEVPMSPILWRHDCDANHSRRPLMDPEKNCAVLDMESNYYFADVSCLGEGEGKICPICERL
ncbi:uncharacterized protein [Palaemon carinicauda]|uniref:uncharacterized protein n=1 Tax=Palaemon carinicauda TaxID=392227 RepID=UPI0035B667AC